MSGPFLPKWLAYPLGIIYCVFHPVQAWRVWRSRGNPHG
jgi:hypothetical protein